MPTSSTDKVNFWHPSMARKLIAVAVALVIIIAGLLISFTKASGFYVAVEPEQGTATTNAKVVADTNASGGKAIQFAPPASGGGGSTTPPPSGGGSGGGTTPTGWPNASNTGYTAAPDYPGSLTPFSGNIQSNHAYRFMDFAGGAWIGSQSTAVTNVTFYGCRFHDTNVGGALVALFGDNITFDYSTFEPDAPFVAGQRVAYNKSYQYGIEANGGYGSHVGQLTVSHSNFWGFGNAVDLRGSTQAKPQVFRDNWIHDAAADGNGAYHTDGIGDLSGNGSGAYVVIDHNTIVSPGNTNGLAFQQGSYNHFTITNNLFGGFGYTIALWAPAPYTTFTGNTYTTAVKPLFGPLYPQNFWSSTGSIWRNNKWLVPPGAEYGNPADSGKYWWPNGSLSTADYGG